MPSSVIHGMLYSPEQQVLLIVFQGEGEVYRYREVNEAEWQAFRRAPSKGTHLNHVFKAKHPRFDRLGEADLAGGQSGRQAESPQDWRDLPDVNVWGFYETNTL